MNQIVVYTPRNYQTEIIEKSIKHFQKHNKGILVLICGVGKTLISLWITQELKSNTILIGVPSILLLDQWFKIICKLFPNIPILIVSDGIQEENIIQFLTNNTICIVITTYASVYKIKDATQKMSFTFSMKINDEVHHLTSIDKESSDKGYIKMLDIKSDKQLSLTATLKHIENKCNADNVISNDNVEYFGEIIDRKCLLWAIKENIICDYVIQTIIADETQLKAQLVEFNIVLENDKRLFLSAYASLKSISDGYSHHIFIYSNNKNNSEKLVQYIKMLLDDKYFVLPELYYSNYHSDMKSGSRKEIKSKFEKSKFGIITCVYCFSEGYDFPKLDCVVFAENMTSEIRIVQSALRSNRKDNASPNKISKIILPILNSDWLENNENPDLKKIRTVINLMGLDDETIIQKIKVYKINIEKHKPQENTDKKKTKEEPKVNDFGEYDEELTKKLKLQTRPRNAFNITYTKAREIIVSKNITNWNGFPESYNELCDKDIRLSTDPETEFKGQFTNWIEYLSIEYKYYDLKECKNKVNKYLSDHQELTKYNLELSELTKELCKLDPMFPPSGLWVYYYKVKDLRDIIIINNPKKKRTGAIL